MKKAKARDIMTSNTQCIGENETLVEAARKMRDLDVGDCRSAVRTTVSMAC